MECSCIRHSGQKFDFHLDLLDCETLVFTDLSNWMDEDYYVIPEDWPMTVTLPSGSTVEINFKPKGTTIITSENIGVIRDGIYCFKTESCGHVYSRNEAVLCNLECKYDTLLASLDVSLNSPNKDVLEKVKTLSSYLNAIRLNAKLGKTTLATKFFKIVSEELKNIDCL